MLELISLHIPKTAGTSFYHLLKQVYGEQLSLSYRRRDILTNLSNGDFTTDTLAPRIRVLHGHFHYSEIAALHSAKEAKLICWIREPLDRLVSNYRFFKAGLENPERNPEQYKLNKHRLNESLLEYAERLENRNRISQFLAGSRIDDFFFWGRMSHFTEDVLHLSRQLAWPTNLQIPTLNQSTKQDNPITALSAEEICQLEEWNSADLVLYRRVLANIRSSSRL